MKTAILAVACCVAMSTGAFAYKLDAKGKCHADDGKFAKATMCSTTAAPAGYKLDAKGKCHDAKGKFAKADLCKA